MINVCIDTPYIYEVKPTEDCIFDTDIQYIATGKFHTSTVIDVIYIKKGHDDSYSITRNTIHFGLQEKLKQSFNYTGKIYRVEQLKLKIKINKIYNLYTNF